MDQFELDATGFAQKVDWEVYRLCRILCGKPSAYRTMALWEGLRLSFGEAAN